MKKLSIVLLVCLFTVSFLTCEKQNQHVKVPELPVMAVWGWWDTEFQPNGYREFIDMFADHSPYALLTTTLRVFKKQVTEQAVHDQIKRATQYANHRDLKISMDLDVRLARAAFLVLLTIANWEMIFGFPNIGNRHMQREQTVVILFMIVYSCIKRLKGKQEKDRRLSTIIWKCYGNEMAKLRMVFTKQPKKRLAWMHS